MNRRMRIAFSVLALLMGTSVFTNWLFNFPVYNEVTRNSMIAPACCLYILSIHADEKSKRKRQ